MKDDVLVRNFIIAANSRRTGIVVVKLPSRDGSIAAYAAAHVNHARRTKIRPRKLLFARPTDLHRPLGRARQSRRFDCCFAGVLAAISRTRIRHQDAHSIFGNSKRLGELSAHAERALRSGPHGQVVAVPLRQRGSRFEWSMRDVRHGVRLLQTMIGRAQRLIHAAEVKPITVSGGVFTFDRILPQIIE